MAMSSIHKFLSAHIFPLSVRRGAGAFPSINSGQANSLHLQNRPCIVQSGGNHINHIKTKKDKGGAPVLATDLFLDYLSKEKKKSSPPQIKASH